MFTSGNFWSTGVYILFTLCEIGRSSLNFNQKGEIELLIVQLVANLFIFSIGEVGDYKNCNLKVIGIAINEIDNKKLYSSHFNSS